MPRAPARRNRLDSHSAHGQRLSESEYLDRYAGVEGWTEWVDGRVIVMRPPTFRHAELAAFLLSLLAHFVEERDPGTVLTGSYQVRFARMRRRRSPDLMFISHGKLKRAKVWHFDGAPDLIVEIISADSRSRDREDKYAEYQRAGVNEYWIVDPLS